MQIHLRRDRAAAPGVRRGAERLLHQLCNEVARKGGSPAEAFDLLYGERDRLSDFYPPVGAETLNPIIDYARVFAKRPFTS